MTHTLLDLVGRRTPVDRGQVWIMNPDGEIRQWLALIKSHPIANLKQLIWGRVGNHPVTTIIPDTLLQLALAPVEPELMFGVQGNIVKVNLVDNHGHTRCTPCRVEGIYEGSGVYLITLGFILSPSKTGYDLAASLSAKVTPLDFVS